jgi:hypothetical protein
MKRRIQFVDNPKIYNYLLTEDEIILKKMWYKTIRKNEKIIKERMRAEYLGYVYVEEDCENLPIGWEIYMSKKYNIKYYYNDLYDKSFWKKCHVIEFMEGVMKDSNLLNADCHV